MQISKQLYTHTCNHNYMCACMHVHTHCGIRSSIVTAARESEPRLNKLHNKTRVIVHVYFEHLRGGLCNYEVIVLFICISSCDLTV